MTTLTPAQLAYYNYKYFGDLGPQVVANMTATALAESDGRMVVGAQNSDGSYDRSAWQINDAHGYDRERLISDPDYAAQAARQVYDKQGITAWSAWNAGAAYDRWDDAAGAVQTLYATDHPESLAPITATNTGSSRQRFIDYIQQSLGPEGIAGITATGGAGAAATGGSSVADPIQTLTGVELKILADSVANMLTQTRYSGLEGAGYADLGGLNAMPGAYGIGPSFAREQWQTSSQLERDRLNQQGSQFGSTLELDTQRVELQRQQLEAARLDAERQYGLDLQRFGLQYADTAYRQRLDAAVQQTNQLKALASFQGPRDWLRYNYLENNMPAPVTPTVDANMPGVQPTVGGQPPGMAGPGGLLALDPMQRAQQLAAEWNKTHPADNTRPEAQLGAAGLRSTGPIPGVNHWDPQKGWIFTADAAGGGAAAAPSEPNEPLQSGYYDQATGVSGEAFRNPEGSYSSNWTPAEVGGGVQNNALTVGGENGVPQYQWDPNGTGGIKMLAFGGYSDQGMGGMHRAVVGDPQRRGRPNPELVMSRSPITALPLQANPRARQMAQRSPRFATGGVTGLPTSAGQGGVTGQTGPEVAASPAITGAPFVTKVTQGGAPSFGARAEDLGPYGRSPLNYSSMLQLLPSEQEMMRGYIETPPELGGLGGWFPDEVARAQRSSFQGLDFGPSGYAAA